MNKCCRARIPVLYSKFEGLRPVGFRENILKCFIINCHGGHLGQKTGSFE